MSATGQAWRLPRSASHTSTTRTTCCGHPREDVARMLRGRLVPWNSGLTQVARRTSGGRKCQPSFTTRSCNCAACGVVSCCSNSKWALQQLRACDEFSRQPQQRVAATDIARSKARDVVPLRRRTRGGLRQCPRKRSPHGE